MPLINCQVELKLKWTNNCLSSANGNDNTDPNDIRDTKYYVSMVTLSAKDNKKLSKLLRKGFERSVYWNEYKTRSENKNMTSEYRYFLESNFVNVKRLLLLI